MMPFTSFNLMYFLKVEIKIEKNAMEFVVVVVVVVVVCFCLLRSVFPLLCNELIFLFIMTRYLLSI